ncbi:MULTISPECIES: aromatic amino acid transport family protein [unclassified Pseudoalteromonas]|uniref:aromatic amino acid transport family protein n=1 Tax=unclassified Pseudoalteromonas TaxID=194690 RepID=UPI000429A5AF|nr:MULTISPECIES: aromatic amino acid transport family protein [unclassified Pseudoalteromonas]MDC9497374.1 aromatic amino acid transport family protein [Pseudoalteromonas sp. Angola-20]MDC9517395.1 aromatic amino acid transport family protein [Pseudoalteromonas sp. Angola-22]MDC9533885.1 aromatic amino acid transport family protein [Pseudoalteromonas sp. Angola-9]TMP80306.1 threonine/serine transporter TdcC [Pseudoalteromonas sp. S983]
MTPSQDATLSNASTTGEHTPTSKWNLHDTQWTLSLFGTAVGAGILFLPINIGIGGFWPLIIMACLAFPMTFLAHRGLARFVLSSKNKDSDFTDVVEEHFGVTAGRLISLLYFLSIFPILLIYGVGLTNTVDSFMVNQMGLESPSRVLLSGVLVAGMISLMMGGERLMLRAFAILVYPLVGILFCLSLYLIPSWQMPDMSLPEAGSFTKTLWLSIPIIVFSFSHAAAISSFVNVQRGHYGNQATNKAEAILKRTSLLLIVFVLLFVFSCVLSLTSEQMAAAKAANVSILSYLANITSNSYIATLGPLVAFIAITSSFLGHFLGARESFTGLVTKQTSLSAKVADKIGVLIMFFAIWFCAVKNPSILDMMDQLSGPIIAMILFIMPMIAVYKVPSLSKYRNRLSTLFVLAVGSLAVCALIYSMLN